MNIGKMIRGSAILLSVCFAMPLSAEILGSWQEDGENTFVPDASPRNMVKILSKKPEFSVELTEKPGEKKRLQIVFKKPYTLTGGKKYRFTIEVKADSSIEFDAGVIIAKTPYPSIPKSWKRFRLKPEYRTFSHEFTADKNYDGAIYAPILVFREGNAGTKISLRKAVFESVEGGILPLPATPEWTLFAKPGIKREELQKLTEIPEKLGSAEVQKITIGETFLKIPGAQHEKDEAVLMTVIESPEDGQMQAGFAADWWAEIYVNGFRCASTLDTGNMSHKFIPEEPISKLFGSFC